MIYINQYGCIIYSFLFLGELTNPIMQAVELNKLTNLYKNTFVNRMEYYNIVLYCLVRFIVAPIYFFTIVNYIQDNVLVTLSMISMFVILYGSYNWVKSKYNIIPNWCDYMYYS